MSLLNVINQCGTQIVSLKCAENCVFWSLNGFYVYFRRAMKTVAVILFLAIGCLAIIVNTSPVPDKPTDVKKDEISGRQAAPAPPAAEDEDDDDDDDDEDIGDIAGKFPMI